MRAACVIVSLLALSASATAQPKAAEPDCHAKWAARFAERLADPVTDGTYTDVIITIRQDSHAQCMNGKAIVAGGRVTRIFLSLGDGSFEEVQRTWKDRSNENVRVVNGMSGTMVSTRSEQFNVLWPRKLRPPGR